MRLCARTIELPCGARQGHSGGYRGRGAGKSIAGLIIRPVSSASVSTQVLAAPDLVIESFRQSRPLFCNLPSTTTAACRSSSATGKWKPIHRNLHGYFTQTKLPNIQFPSRRFYTTNDPVLTPALIDHFFNVRTKTFEKLSERKKALLHTICDLAEYRAVLPAPSDNPQGSPLRRHERFSVKCPGRVSYTTTDGGQEKLSIKVVEVSSDGFKALAHGVLPLNNRCDATIKLGHDDVSRVSAYIMRKRKDESKGLYSFRLGEPDINWRKFVAALNGSKI